MAVGEDVEDDGSIAIKQSFDASGNCVVVTGSSDDIVRRDVVMMVVRDGIVFSLEDPLLVT